MENFLQTCKLNDICPVNIPQIEFGQFKINGNRYVSIVNNCVINITTHAEYPMLPHCDMKHCYLRMSGYDCISQCEKLKKVALSYSNPRELFNQLDPEELFKNPESFPCTRIICDND